MQSVASRQSNMTHHLFISSFLLATTITVLLLLTGFAEEVRAAAIPLTIEPSCSAEEGSKVNEEFLQCQAKAQAKLRDSALDICDFFEESINRCGNILNRCSTETKIREVKENTARVSVRAMSVESGSGGFDHRNCSVLQQFNITEPSDEKVIDGVCTEKEFHLSYKGFYDCKSESEGAMQKNLISVAKGDTEAFDRFVCLHFEHTLNNCFSKIRKCSTSPQHWTETRRAFIVSATKANEAKKIGLNLGKCRLLAEEDKEEDEEAGQGKLQRQEQEHDGISPAVAAAVVREEKLDAER